MAQRPVPEVGDDHFRLVEPVMDGLVVGNDAAPFPDAGQSVMARTVRETGNTVTVRAARCAHGSPG
jgi:hypothetical protein